MTRSVNGKKFKSVNNISATASTSTPAPVVAMIRWCERAMITRWFERDVHNRLMSTFSFDAVLTATRLEGIVAFISGTIAACLRLQVTGFAIS